MACVFTKASAVPLLVLRLLPRVVALVQLGLLSVDIDRVSILLQLYELILRTEFRLPVTGRHCLRTHGESRTSSDAAR